MNDKNLTEELNETFSRIKSIIRIQNSKGFDHKVAIAEEQYPPELADHFGDIAFVNSMINTENKNNGIGMFRLWKSQVKKMRKTGENEVVPRNVNNRWREYQRSGRPGYHIGEGRAMTKFAQFIRRFFRSQQNWNLNEGNF